MSFSSSSLENGLTKKLVNQDRLAQFGECFGRGLSKTGNRQGERQDDHLSGKINLLKRDC